MKIITVHSLRGGAGRTTLALKMAREAGPGTVLVETDLMGTSLADADARAPRAPDFGLAPDAPISLRQAPTGWLSPEETARRVAQRHRLIQGGAEPAAVAVPFLNDWLLYQPEPGTSDDAIVQAFLWNLDGVLVIPSSPLPSDQIELEAIVGEHGFIEYRLEVLVAALALAGVQTIVFDTGRGVRGVAGDVLSLALRLAHKQPISVDGALVSPLALTLLDVEIYMLSLDGDGPALGRWLACGTERERQLIKTVEREPRWPSSKEQMEGCGK